MQKKEYRYNYPEQIKMSEGLESGDIVLIASMTNKSKAYISLMCKGKRKMTDDIKMIVERFAFANKYKRSIIEDVMTAQAV